ncbi:MAG: phospholipase D-like domain-containing protein, partial [Gammaproteobacteria bacterium]
SITFAHSMTIVGGRNIGAEYFGASDAFNYRDLDVLGIGPVAEAVSAEFDLYWNTDATVPVTAFVEPDDSPEALQAVQDRMDNEVEKAKSTPYAAALGSSLAELIFDKDSSELYWASAKVVYDLPYGEESAEGVEGPEVLAGILREAVQQAETELFVVSPYFVPGESGVEGFRELVERGVRCVVITNSLASTDVSAVYGGYSKYQKGLLEAGVELWEVMAFPEIAGHERGASTDRRSLHAKTFVLDQEQVFVGSFNWDPRSVSINTEMGVLIESPEMGAEMVKSVSAAFNGTAWKLRLNEKGKVEWVDDSGEKEVVYQKPPQTSTWRRFSAWATGLDAIEGQL